MHICIREDAYRADRCEAARIFRPRKSPKRRTFHAKLTNCGARNFRGSERERRGGGRGTTRGWHKEEYGVRRWRCANEFSMPFPYPISMIGVYRRERLIENFGRIELFVCPFDFHFRRAFFHYILLILALSMILLERKIDRKFF